MAFKKAYRKYTKRTTKGSSAGVQALAEVRRLARKVKPEVKVFDAGGQSNYASTGTVLDLCIPSQGTTYINRVGLAIKPTTLEWRCNFAMASAATNTALRFIFFRGRSEEGVPFTTGDILIAAAIDQPLVWLSRDKIKVFYDRTFMLNDNAASGGLLNRKFNLNGILEFTGNGTGIETGGIYVLIISSEATNTPAVDWHARTHFTDV